MDQTIGNDLKQWVIEYACSLLGGSYDQPFENDFESTVLRHNATGKWFGLLMNLPICRFTGNESDQKSAWVLNLKCEPEDSIVWREMFSDIYPGYHMNKRHWISVLLRGNVSTEVLERLIYKSYLLTSKNGRKKRQCEH